MSNPDWEFAANVLVSVRLREAVLRALRVATFPASTRPRLGLADTAAGGGAPAGRPTTALLCGQLGEQGGGLGGRDGGVLLLL